jgi:hypothetical protein
VVSNPNIVREELISKALKVINELKVFSTDILARKLNVDRTTAEMILAVLVAEGYIREVSGGNPCEYCPLAKICTPERRALCPLRRTHKFYVITEKARSVFKKK